MALAESQHHSAQHPKMARAREWGSEQNHTATTRKTPHCAAGALNPRGMPTAALVRKQRRLRSWWRHELGVDRCGAGYGVTPFVPQGGHRERRPTETEHWHQHGSGTCRVMMAGLLQGRGWLPCWSPSRRRRLSGTAALVTRWSRLSMLLCCRWYNSCRTSSSSSPRSACGCRAGYQRAQDLFRGHPFAQLAEQLVEVPTILYFLKQRIPEQIVDNPVPRGRVRRLQGFFARTESNSAVKPSSSLTFQFMVEVYKVCAQNRVRSALLSRSLTFVVAHLPLLALPGAHDADDAFQLGFRTFPLSKKKKKSGGHPAGHCRSRRGHQLMDARGL